jgi:hypothetical protein
MGLLDSALPEMAEKAEQMLKELAALSKVNIKDMPITRNEDGTVTIDGTQFAYSNGRLTMIGYCQQCRMEVPSKPIRTWADIGDQLRRFKPDPKHDCMDVD